VQDAKAKSDSPAAAGAEKISALASEMPLVRRRAPAHIRRMSIRDWPSGERPREKLLAKGAAALSDAELLAILLRTGTPGCSAVDLAREILKSFRSLRQLIAADRQRFCAEAGLGPTRYAELQAAIEIGRRQLSELLTAGPSLGSPRATGDFLMAKLRDLEHEVFCCLYLDKRHRLIEFQELFRGTIDGASVHPREIVKLALQRNCAAVIVAHNHPLCCIAVSPPGFGFTPFKRVASLARH
jgi:DNA repair protein RadC